MLTFLLLVLSSLQPYTNYRPGRDIREKWEEVTAIHLTSTIPILEYHYSVPKLCLAWVNFCRLLLRA